MFLILDYKHYYTYLPYFNNIGLIVFSFINRLNCVIYLDFYYLFNFDLLQLEKIFFLSKILQLYNFYFFKKLYILENFKK